MTWRSCYQRAERSRSVRLPRGVPGGVDVFCTIRRWLNGSASSRYCLHELRSFIIGFSFFRSAKLILLLRHDANFCGVGNRRLPAAPFTENSNTWFESRRHPENHGYVLVVWRREPWNDGDIDSHSIAFRISG